jgi:tetratricopeptide (TPR) repeat protein
MSKSNALTRGKKRKVMELLDAGELEQARTLLEQICRTDRRDLESWLYLGGVSNALGRPDEAERAYQQARKIDPKSFQAFYGLAVAAENHGDREAAIDLYRRAIAIEPQLAPAYNNLGSVLHELERYDEAVDCYRRALELEPENPQMSYNLGITLQAQEKLEEAAGCYRRATELDPTHSSAYNNLAVILNRMGKPWDALEQIQRALSADPNSADAYDTQGRILQMQSRMRLAVQSLKYALALDPQNVKTLNLLTSLSLMLGETEAANEYLQRSIEIEPDNTGAIAAQIQRLDLQGNVAEARRLLQPLLEQTPVPIDFATAYAKLCHHSKECDKALPVLEEAIANSPRLPAELMPAHFAAGDVLDRMGEYDRAFAHYVTANQLKPVEFDPETHAEFVDRLTTVFALERLPNLAHAGNASELPVFILGMPRSGTTLVEQILAAHPHVVGAGELDDIGQTAAALRGTIDPESTYPEVVTLASSALLDERAQQYLEKLERLGGGALRVTDKMPHNFLHIGLIQLLLPRARIIHCRRDPLDTCLSCYFHDFTGRHPYAYDLGHLGFYYREYERLMEHWRKLLGPHLLEIQYEDLVADLEGVSRKMVDYCGLEWSDDCLRFYESKRLVHTASYDQVRRPIYSKSIGRWRRYESHLQPLKRALNGGSNSV